MPAARAGAERLGDAEECPLLHVGPAEDGPVNVGDPVEQGEEGAQGVGDDRGGGGLQFAAKAAGSVRPSSVIAG